MNNKKKGFFLDRDGVINKDVGYVCKKKQFKWLKGVKRGIKLLNDQKFKVIVVSNQAGVAKGFIKENFLNDLNLWINKILSKNGAKIDKFYYCPYHEKGKVEKFKKKSFCRKPNPGMILQGIKHYKLNKKECYMIGDRKKDYQAAKKANIKFFYQKDNLYKQIKTIINV